MIISQVNLFAQDKKMTDEEIKAWKASFNNSTVVSRERTTINPTIGAVPKGKSTAAERYNLLSNNVAYWFDCTKGRVSERDLSERGGIFAALNRTVYGENEFEQNRDKKNVERRFSEMKNRVYGIKRFVLFPSFNFTSKTYNFSGAPDMNDCVDFIFVNEYIVFTPLRIDEETAEEIHNLNSQGYFQEIVFKPDRLQTVEENYAHAISIAGPIPREDFMPSPTWLYRIIASKITLNGYRDLYSNNR